MSNTTRHQTLQMKSDSKSVSYSEANFTGRILQIHPVDLDSGLITLSDKPFVIGREPTSDLMIGERAVSRQHAKFEKSKEGFTVTDLGSTNGTWVNGENIEVAQLRTGDRIRIGGRIFKFIATDQVEAQYHEAVYSMMTKDNLTQAWNKRYLLDMLGRELKRRERTGHPLSLLILDLDYFKKVNDSYGHLVGDELLRQAASRLRNVLREEDVFARFGGEEFCIVLSETCLEAARDCAKRCLSAISETPFSTAAGDIDCTVSIGIAEASKTMTSKELIKLADERLYQAKEQGRNRFEG